MTDALQDTMRKPTNLALRARKQELVQDLLDARSVGEVRRIKSDLEEIIDELPKTSASAVMVDERVREGFSKYLSTMLREGLILESEGRFSITERGMEFLKEYHDTVSRAILTEVDALGSGGEPVAVEAIRSRLTQFSDVVVDEATQQLLKDGVLFSPRPGYVMRHHEANRGRED
jgi:predicted transcriptional regulator